MITNKDGDHIGGTIALDKKDFTYNEKTKTAQIISKLKIQNFERNDENNLITFTSAGSGTGIDEWGFKLPSYDGNYKIKQIVFEIHGNHQDDVYECMFTPITVKSGTPWFQYDIADIDLLPSTQLSNQDVKLKLICGYFMEEKVVMIRARVKKPTGIWRAQQYTLKGYYLLELIED